MVDKLRPHLGKMIRWLNNVLKQLDSLVPALSGILPEIKTKWFSHPSVFCDRFGFQFWQYPGDEVRLNWKRKAICDSIGVARFIREYVKVGSVCIDIGACVAGISVPMWSRTGSSGKVISVEADPAKIEKIKANLTLNGFPQTFVVNAAISDRVEPRSFRCYPKSAGWNTFGDPPFAKDYESFLIDVQCIDFSSLLQEYNIESVDIVKIDTEGSELLVLRGMLPFLINKQIGCVVFEVNQLMLSGMDTTVNELISFWDSLPYTLFFLRDDGSISEFSKDWPDHVVGDVVALVDKR